MDIFLLTLFLIICVLLILVVLLQKGRGGGLGSAFGGAGSSAFGTRTGDVFTWVTIVLTALFLVLAIVTSHVVSPEPGTVVTPIFSLPSGSGEGDKPIAVSINYTKGSTVYYTLDGSDPTERSTKYEDDAVTVNPKQTLKARAYRPGWKPSDVAVWEFSKPVTPETQEETPTETPTETPAAAQPETPTTPAEPEPAEAE